MTATAGSTTDVLVLAGLFPPAVRGGGVIRSLDALVSVPQAGYAMHVLTTNADLGRPDALPVVANQWIAYRSARVMYLDARSLGSLARAIREIRRLRPQIYYVNSFFSPQFTILPLVLLSVGVLPRARVLLAPRGEFSPGALAIKAAKKRGYLRVFRLLRQLLPALIWHATTDRERDEIVAAVGDASSIVVWERDTVLTAVPADPEPSRSGAALRVIFLSRLVVKKGLTTLLSALAEVSEPVDLDVYGPREDQSYWMRCEGLIQNLPRHVRVTYRGVIVPSCAVRTFSQYDLFAFPTAGENFGHVIAESLAGSCPVMITDTTPWTHLLDSGGGVVLGSGVGDWTSALTEYARLSVRQRAERRRGAAQAYVQWQRIPRDECLFALVP